MNNYEYYKEEIDSIVDKIAYCNFMQKYVLKEDCGNFTCIDCHRMSLEWAQKEPETNWDEVPMNTPVLVRDCERERWREKKFAMYLPAANYPFYVFGEGSDKEHATCTERYTQCKLLYSDKK